MDGNAFEAKMPAPLLTSKEAALILRVSERTLWGLTSPRGPIRPVKIRRLVRYSPETIQNFIQSQVITHPLLAA
jgi:hypothetical protein